MELRLEAGLERGFRIVHLVGEGELRLLHGKLVLQRILGFRSAALHRLLLLSPLFREVNFQQPRPRYQPEDPFFISIASSSFSNTVSNRFSITSKLCLF